MKNGKFPSRLASPKSSSIWIFFHRRIPVSWSYWEPWCSWRMIKPQICNAMEVYWCLFYWKIYAKKKINHIDHIVACIILHTVFPHVQVSHVSLVFPIPNVCCLNPLQGCLSMCIYIYNYVHIPIHPHDITCTSRLLMGFHPRVFVSLF